MKRATSRTGDVAVQVHETGEILLDLGVPTLQVQCKQMQAALRGAAAAKCAWATRSEISHGTSNTAAVNRKKDSKKCWVFLDHDAVGKRPEPEETPHHDELQPQEEQLQEGEHLKLATVLHLSSPLDPKWGFEYSST